MADKDLYVTVPDGEIINEIYPFCNQGVDNRDLEPLADYLADTQRLIGHQPGIARAQLANRQARQSSHMAAGLAQFLSRRYEAGVLDDGDLDKIEAALARVIDSIIARAKYELGEFYFFRYPTLRPGFEVLDGGIIENGAEMYPDFWQFIQTSEGQLLCKTPTERQALAEHVYHTLYDGTELTYGGIGGVPFYTVDLGIGSITMPDIRGMYSEAAGFDSLTVGAVGIDRLRNLTGCWQSTDITSHDGLSSNQGWMVTGSTTSVGEAFGYFDYKITSPSSSYSRIYERTIQFNAANQSPTGSTISPRHFGVLACAWMGVPAL